MMMFEHKLLRKSNLDLYSYLKKIFIDLGIKKGDIVYVASDILKLIILCKHKKIKFDQGIIVNCLQDIIGNNGTLLFPTYNWDFCNGKTFNIKKTKSKCGTLSNYVLERSDFKRTKHPIYSLAVSGKLKSFFCNLKNKDSWGINSPFHHLFKKKSKNLFIGIDYKDSFTMDHYFEQLMNVKYRYHKNFSADYIDEKSKKKNKEYSMYVRNKSECDFTMISPSLDKILSKSKAYSYLKRDKIKYSLVDVSKAGKILINDLKKNKSKLIYPVKN